MHYYQFNIGDYASHTSRLTPIEDIAYRRMLDLYYLNEQPLNGCESDVAREIGLSDHLESVKYVLSKFFIKEENFFRQKRIDVEIKKYKSNAKNKSKAGKASAKARQAKASKQVTGVEQVLNTKPTDEQLNINHKPITNNHKPLTKVKDNRAKRFAPPSLENAVQYFGERAMAKNILINPNEPEKFIDFYESKNWMVGKNKMKDWKAAVRNWLSNVKPEKQNIIEQSAATNWHEEDLGI
tara:strand:- start:393 stop:1109 length:717 start_codon:yes stop_codon:yes gene_type:complete